MWRGSGCADGVAAAAVVGVAGEMEGSVEGSTAKGWESKSGSRSARSMEPSRAVRSMGRGEWGRQREFLLVCVGSAVGYGNVASWPALMMEFGGAFLLASLVLLAGLGLPLLVVELGLGQFHSAGLLKTVRRFLPLAEGLGWAVFLFHFAVTVLYGSLVARWIYALAISVSPVARSCLPPDQSLSWNSAACWTRRERDFCVAGADKERFFAGKAFCYEEDAVLSAYVGRLEDCLWAAVEGRAEEAGPECAFRLRFFFNASTPHQLFRPRVGSALHHDIINRPGEICDEDGHMDLLRPSRQVCQSRLERMNRAWWTGTDGRPQPVLYLIDLLDWGKPETLVRAKCLHKFLEGADVGPVHCQRLGVRLEPPLVAGRAELSGQLTADLAYRKPRLPRPSGLSGADVEAVPKLGCLLRDYCARTFPVEELSDIGCVRRVVRPSPSLSFIEIVSRAYDSPDVETRPRWLSIRPAAGLCLCLAWGLTAKIVSRDTESLGRLVGYGLTLVPLAMVVVPLFPAMFLPGGVEGASLYFRWEPCLLREPRLWMKALNHGLFSINLGYGMNIALGSYARFDTDVVGEAMVMGLGDVGFSTLAGLLYFVLLGHYAATNDLAMEELLSTKIRTGVPEPLTAQVMAEMPLGALLSVGIVLPQLLLILGAHVSLVFSLLTTLQDEWPVLLRHRGRLAWGLSGLMFVLGLPLVSNGAGEAAGPWETVFLAYLPPVLLLLLVVAVVFLYGGLQFVDDLRLMVGGWVVGEWMVERGKGYLLLSWGLLAPTMLVAILVSSMGTGEAHWSSFLMLWVTGALLVGGAAWAVCRRGLSWGALFRPRPSWGPALLRHRHGTRYFRHRRPRLTKDSCDNLVVLPAFRHHD